jgi:hypothetical protein
VSEGTFEGLHLESSGVLVTLTGWLAWPVGEDGWHLPHVWLCACRWAGLVHVPVGFRQEWRGVTGW